MPARLATASALIKQIRTYELKQLCYRSSGLSKLTAVSRIASGLKVTHESRSIGNMSESVANFKLLFQNRIQPIKGFDGNGVGLRSGQVQIIFAVEGSRKADSLGLGESRVSRSERKYPEYR